MSAIVLLAAIATGTLLVLAHATAAKLTLVHTVPSPEPQRSIDHATRIVAGRYARGEITADEYRRTLAILKP